MPEATPERLPETEPGPPVETIDGDVGLDLKEARSLSKKYFIIGFFGLPWMWFLNVWFFWPQFNSPDVKLRRYVRGSAYGFVVFSTMFLPWMLGYMFNGKWLVGPELYHELSIHRLHPEDF